MCEPHSATPRPAAPCASYFSWLHRGRANVVCGGGGSSGAPLQLGGAAPYFFDTDLEQNCQRASIRRAAAFCGAPQPLVVLTGADFCAPRFFARTCVGAVLTQLATAATGCETHGHRTSQQGTFIRCAAHENEHCRPAGDAPRERHLPAPRRPSSCLPPHSPALQAAPCDM